MQKQKNLPGFTLVEILVVVALIAILATLTIVALNPAKNFADTRDTQRSSHVNTILNGITQYTSQESTSIDDFQARNAGNTALEAITPCSGGYDKILLNGQTANAAGEVDIHTLLIDTADILVDIPEDPRNTAANKTAGVSGYEICLQGNRVQINAPLKENATAITVKR